MDKNKILTDLYNSLFMKELLNKITGGHQLKDDLLQELFLILCEMDENKIIDAYNGGYLNYLTVNIIKKMYHSNTSPFHRKYRANKHNELTTNIIDNTEEYDSTIDMKIDLIEYILSTEIKYTDRELFNMYYKLGDYNMIDGDKRDVNCNDATSSYRKIERKLALPTTTINGKKLTICRSSVANSRNRTIEKIKKIIIDNGINFDDM